MASVPGEKCSPRCSPRTAAGAAPPCVTATGRAPQRAQVLAAGAGGAPRSRGPEPARPPRRPAARGPVHTGDQGFRLGELCLHRSWCCGHHFYFPANSAVCPEKDGGEASTWRPRSLVPPQCDQRTRNQGAFNPEPGAGPETLGAAGAGMRRGGGGRGSGGWGGCVKLQSENSPPTTALSTSQDWDQPAPQEATRSATWTNTRCLGGWMKEQKYTD